jgi:seryl-tRNA synthetase
MIDLALLRKDPAFFSRTWADRGADVDIAGLLALDAQVRELKTSGEALKAEVNQASKSIAAAAKGGGDAALVSAAKERARQLGDQAKAADERRIALEQALTDRLLLLPNPCHPEVPIGKDSAGNRVVATWGQPPSFAFTPRPHWEIGSRLGIIDFDRAAKLSGSGFVALRAGGARLSRALISWFLDQHTGEHGYTELAVPYLVQSTMMVGTGQLPKFADQFYCCRDDDLVLIPTAEVPVTNLHAGEILEAAQLPLTYTAHTPCFRREAGAAGIGTRGMTRVHQFDKVELVWLTTPERSDADLLTLRGHAESLLRQLGLHYRVLELCSGDTGFSAARTFDLEVWSPATSSWLEVSSCSTFGDFQARRAGLRYRAEKGGKPAWLHTLNGSALALPRCLIALLETGQQADGTVVVPEVLRPYLGGTTRIGAAP